MPAFETLRDGLGRVRIAHHIPGRIRLRVDDPELIADVPGRAQLVRVQALLERMPGVVSLRVNLMARSCTLEYDHEIIPFAAWGDLIAGRRTAAAARFETLLRAVYDEFAGFRA